MRSAALFFVTLVAAASARLTCTVKPLGGGEDDGPNILAAFKRCGKKGRVTLDQYYVVDTLLLTTDLDDVEIEFTGTGTSVYSHLRRVLTPSHSPVYSGYCQVVSSELLPNISKRVNISL